VKDKSPLGLHRPAQQDSLFAAALRAGDRQLLQYRAEGQASNLPVQDQTHGVFGVVGADENDSAFKAWVANRRKGDQYLAGKVFRCIHLKIFRRPWGGFKSLDQTSPLQARAKGLSLPFPPEQSPETGP
jgi:hypothetical protein